MQRISQTTIFLLALASFGPTAYAALVTEGADGTWTPVRHIPYVMPRPTIKIQDVIVNLSRMEVAVSGQILDDVSWATDNAQGTLPKATINGQTVNLVPVDGEYGTFVFDEVVPLAVSDNLIIVRAENAIDEAGFRSRYIRISVDDQGNPTGWYYDEGPYSEERRSLRLRGMIEAGKGTMKGPIDGKLYSESRPDNRGRAKVLSEIEVTFEFDAEISDTTDKFITGKFIPVRNRADIPDIPQSIPALLVEVGGTMTMAATEIGPHIRRTAPITGFEITSPGDAAIFQAYETAPGHIAADTVVAMKKVVEDEFFAIRLSGANPYIPPEDVSFYFSSFTEDDEELFSSESRCPIDC